MMSDLGYCSNFFDILAAGLILRRGGSFLDTLIGHSLMHVNCVTES